MLVIRARVIDEIINVAVNTHDIPLDFERTTCPEVVFKEHFGGVLRRFLMEEAPELNVDENSVIVIHNVFTIDYFLDFDD